MKILRNILRGSTLATALFIFQACYGIPQSALYEYGMAPMSFSLVSSSTGEPLGGISINVRDYSGLSEIGITDRDGHCTVEIPYERNALGPYIVFQDPEGNYDPKDTMLADLRERDIIIKLVEATE